jgi:hypothetical protein
MEMAADGNDGRVAVVSGSTSRPLTPQHPISPLPGQRPLQFWIIEQQNLVGFGVV